VLALWYKLPQVTGMNHKASCGVLYPPLRGIIRPVIFRALCFWSLGFITTYQFRYAALSELEFHNKI